MQTPLALQAGIRVPVQGWRRRRAPVVRDMVDAVAVVRRRLLWALHMAA